MKIQIYIRAFSSPFVTEIIEAGKTYTKYCNPIVYFDMITGEYYLLLETEKFLEEPK